MAKGTITSARAFANNEVAYIAWDTSGRIDGLLGFELVRLYTQTGDERPLAAWVPFKGQSNDSWTPHTTSEWPVQKMWWRDLTVRKRRDQTSRRPADVHVKYRIRGVGNMAPGLEPVPSSPLGYLTPPIETNEVVITANHGDIKAAFTNGILAAQWLRQAMKTPKGQAVSPSEIRARISKPGDPIREYLTGDVLDTLKSGLERASDEKGEAHLALYELADDELVKLLFDKKKIVNLILSNTSADKSGKWDLENEPARTKLKGAATLQNRMFNNVHIGHNKFTVVSGAKGPEAVITGSTNWTPTGLCGQTNNAIVVESADAAKAYLDYWKRLFADKLPEPKPLTAKSANKQGAALRASCKKSVSVTVDGGKTEVELWYSPNTTNSTKSADSPLPPDLAAVFAEMRKAKDAILFLVFYPSQKGDQSIIAEALKIAGEEPNMIVVGAVSDPHAMPNYQAKAKGDTSSKAVAPFTYDKGNVSMVVASALGVPDVVADFEKELLTLGHAIIHDKIVVLDPLSDDCVVITGSHNLGYKASYSNDENLLVIRGNKSLAQAYATHVMDVYDHYRFRAVQAEAARTKKPLWRGFLDTTDKWQDAYVSKKKGAIARYFAHGG